MMPAPALGEPYTHAGPLGWTPACPESDAHPGMTRRRLLMLAAASVATSIVAPRYLDPFTPAAPAAAAGLGRSRFVPLVGERFRLSTAGGQAIHARLDVVEDVSWKGRPEAAGAEERFVLLFHGPRSPRLDQDVLRVEHPELGTISLLVSPAGRGTAGQDYAAVINRFTPPT